MSDDKKDPAEWHGAKMDFSSAMSYGDYLGLDQILNAQHPRSPNHNEMLRHELQAVRVNMRAGELAPAFKMLARVARIMDQLVHAWGRAGDHDAARIHGDPAVPRRLVRLPVAPVPRARIHLGEQERRPAHGAQYRAGRARDPRT